MPPLQKATWNPFDPNKNTPDEIATKKLVLEQPDVFITYYSKSSAIPLKLQPYQRQLVANHRSGGNRFTQIDARGPVSRVLSHRRYPKPDRIGTGSHSSRPDIAVWLKQPTRAALGRHPWRETRLPDIRREAPIRSCSRWGLPCRGRYRRARCAFTAPFHPCRRIAPVWRSVLCGTVPDPRNEFRWPAGVTRHPCFMEPGLSSASIKR